MHKRLVSVRDKIRDLEPRSGHLVHRIIGGTVNARILNASWTDLYHIIDLACVLRVRDCAADLLVTAEDDETVDKALNLSTEVMWNIQEAVGRVLYKRLLLRVEDHIITSFHTPAMRNARQRVWQQLLESSNEC